MDLTKRKKDLSTNMNHEAAMDTFLGKLGLYRKPTAKDGSCLFRAVAEQIFNCQAEHSRVRKQCIEFMKRNKDRFEAFVEGPFDHHLFNLRSQKEWAGQVEIHALSLMYKCDFLVYQAIGAPPIKATENNYDKTIMLCYSNGNHYDSIYQFSHKKNLALCQSIVFDVLYRKVLPKLAVTELVNKTEQVEKQAESDSAEHSLVNGYASENGEEDEEGWTKVKSRKQGKTSMKSQKGSTEFYVDQSPVTSPCSPNSSKLHWEIMRSVDPDGYRNIELEVWEEMKKEQQQKDQTVAATIQFKRGDRCKVKHPSDDHSYTAIIDDVFENSCKIWIPMLKNRRVVPFSSLKLNESSYRDLSGYHRKQDNCGENGSRGGDDQKIGRRARRSNRSRKTNENFERNQQEGQDEQSGRQRGEKNRRRRNGNPRTKDDRRDSVNQGDNENISLDQGFFEMSESTFPAFPALPGNDTQPETEKQKADEGKDSNPATFWSKLLTAPSPDEEATFNQPLPKMSTSSVESTGSHENDKLTIEENMRENQESNVEEDVKPSNDQEEKHVYWQNMNSDLDQYTSFTFASKLTEDYESTNVENLDSSPDPIAPASTMNGVEEKGSILETSAQGTFDHNQPNSEVHDAIYNETNQNFEVIKNSDRVEVEVEEKEEPLSSIANTDYENPKEKEEEGEEQERATGVTDTACNPGAFNLINLEVATNEIPLENNHDGNQHNDHDDDNHDDDHDEPHNKQPNEQHNQEHKEEHDDDHQSDRVVQPRVHPDARHHPLTATNIQSEIVNGHVTFSLDPEGKDLPKDMDILRHLYNRGVQLYLYYNGVNVPFPGGAPLSPAYPAMMSPTGAMYTAAMHQTYQNQPMMVPQNMCQYPSMQVASQDENQHQQNPGEERRENSGSPGYKQNISPHQSPQYHQHMSPQAMYNMNYGQMFSATGHRQLYPNYNVFSSQRPNMRYSPNKPNFNRPPNNRKHRYYRNDNQQSPKLYTVQSAYGSDSKGSE